MWTATLEGHRCTSTDLEAIHAAWLADPFFLQSHSYELWSKFLKGGYIGIIIGDINGDSGSLDCSL